MGTNLNAFESYDLRTTDVAAAAAFYAGVVGWEVRREGDTQALFARGQRVGQLLALPERARAQGAPAHWLGHVAVEDVEATVRRVLALGGQQLGPPGRAAVLKDAQGAVFALRAQADAQPRPEAVVWNELHTTDAEAAWAGYSALFGWRKAEALEMGPPLGTYQLFTWEGAERSLGAMGNTARLPGVHTHWLFYFDVPDLEVALERVRQLGGLVANGPMEVPGGGRVAQCEDAQGAAFALHHFAAGA